MGSVEMWKNKSASIQDTVKNETIANAIASDTIYDEFNEVSCAFCFYCIRITG